MGPDIIPEFAIVGHPNEGKSSVVSTLAEDDSVRISSAPGETVECQTFPVNIDGVELIRFVDTPGFQNPGSTLQWMREYQGSDESIIPDFQKAHTDDMNFVGEYELFTPIANGAGIIYVVDGSRPLRGIDRAEMEILRLTGRPRMAIINCKDEETGYLEQWKGEFRKHFNSIRVFNAHRATYAERIALLESLKSIDQDWEPVLEKVISAFKKDWSRRNHLTVEILCELFTECVEYSINTNINDKTREETIKTELREKYSKTIGKMEKSTHRKIRRLFKQNIFDYNFPEHSILHEDLFSDKTWQVLGLTPGQLIATAGLTGGAVGAAIDIAAAGLTFGVFTAIGGAVGAGWAALGGGKRLADIKISGFKLGGEKISMGPNENVQFLYVLIDRALTFYSHIINWAHGRRDYQNPSLGKSRQLDEKGYVAGWTGNEKRICQDFFKSSNSGNENRKQASRKQLKDILLKTMYEISNSGRENFTDE